MHRVLTYHNKDPSFIIRNSDPIFPIIYHSFLEETYRCKSAKALL